MLESTIQSAGTWTGTISNKWFVAGNWLCGGAPTSTTDVVLPSGLTNYPSIDTGNAYVRNITIQSGASLTVTNTGDLSIAGTISNTGTFTASSGTVEMTGSSAQSIPAGTLATKSIKNLVLNNAAGVTLGDTLRLTGILKAVSGTFNTGNYLTLVSNASGTALIDGSGAGSVTGNVTMQRYLPSGFGYKYISSPFAAAHVGQLSGQLSLTASFPTFYKYDENLTSSGWVNYTDTTGVLSPFSGYAANFGSAAAQKTVYLTGVVNNGARSTTLYNHNRTYTQGFNLVGNPYPSPIDWNAASGWTRTNVDNAVYYFNAGTTNQYTGTYSSYINGVSSDGVASNIIPSMQGFFVHITNGTYPVTGTLSINNNARVSNLTAAYHRGTGAGDRPLVRLSAGFEDQNIASDPVVVYFDDNATALYDRDVDALKMMNTDERVPNLYALSADGYNLSIDAMPDPGDSAVIVPLVVDAPHDGQVTFKVSDIQQMHAGMHIYFTDARAANTQELQIGGQYRIQLEKGTYQNRFYLGLGRNASVMQPLSSNDLTAYYSGNSVFVYALSGKGTVLITNALGQIVKSEEVIGMGYHEIGVDVSSGVYLVTLSGEFGKKSKKVIIGH